MDGCSFILHPARYVDPEPPEYCDEYAEPGEDYCAAHLHVMENE